MLSSYSATNKICLPFLKESYVRWQWQCPVLVTQSRECPRPSNVGHQSYRFRIAGGNIVKMCIYSTNPGKPFYHLNLSFSLNLQSHLIRSADILPRLCSLSQNRGSTNPHYSPPADRASQSDKIMSWWNDRPEAPPAPPPPPPSPANCENRAFDSSPTPLTKREWHLRTDHLADGPGK